MARPKKNNADYFSHDSGMRNDVKIKALRRKFGFMGYAIWCYLLESLTEADFFELDWTELSKELLSGDFDCTVEDLESVVSYLLKLNLIAVENDKIVSYQLRKRFNSLLSKRKRQVKWVIDVDNSVIASDNPQSKVKESKVKESIKKDSKEKRQLFKPPTLLEIEELFFKKIGITEFSKLEAELFFNFYSSKNWMVGKTKMKSYPHAVNRWIAQNKKRDIENGKKNTRTPEQRDQDLRDSKDRPFGVII